MTRNIVLICLDTVRYDYFTSFAPRLEGRDGMSFLRCYAASSWSMPSHASIFTETLPHIHDIHPGKTFTFAKLEQDDTFLGRLDGYKIMGISANAYASSGFAFDELFDQFHDYSPSVPFQAGLKPQVLQRQTGKSGRERYLNFLTRCLAADHPIKSLANGVWGVMPKTDYIAKCTPLSYANHRGAEEIGELALEYANTTTEPFFIFLNLMDAHGTYEPLPQYDESLYNVPDGWHSDDLDPDTRISPSPNGDAQPHVENYREIYRAAIEYVDSVINSLINDLLAQTNRETTVILFSDHGENLGYESDEYLVGHNSLSNSVLHTPLKIINPPASYPSEVEEPISQLQLGSLINSIAGNESFPNDICRDIIPAEAPRAGGGPGGDLIVFNSNLYR